MYYDSVSRRFRTQIFYSIMGLDSTKVFDLVIDEKNELVAVQTDNDCTKTKFKNKLFSVNLFFSMFNSLTDYEGLDSDGLKKFKVKQFSQISNVASPKFYFLFDKDNVFAKSRIVQQDIGNYDFESIIPMKSREFSEDHWFVVNDCRNIEQYILDDSSNFVSFMYQLIVKLVGSENDILSFLGVDSEMIGLKVSNMDYEITDSEDEDFDD
jgi:hypothetical protein